MWNFLWTSDLFYHKLAIFREEELWEIKIKEKDKIARKDFYLAQREKENFLFLSSGKKVFCAENFPAGQEKIVQVIQEERGEKLAEVSQKLEISGKFFIYFPYETKLGISKKISESQERKRLQEIVAPFMKEGSFLIRTEAKGQEREVLERELQNLLEDWKEIQENAFQKRKKGKLLDNRFWMEEILEKYAGEEWGFCYTEHFEEEEALGKALLYYGQKSREYHREPSLWQKYQLKQKIQQLCQERVELGEGVYLFLERTQACITVDVNTLKTKIKTANEMAAKEIPKQLRLRNWSGIVIVDFIDGREEEKKELERILREGFAKEVKEIQWGGFQSFYLFSFTKQRKGQEIETYFGKENIRNRVQDLEDELQGLLQQKEKIFQIVAEKKMLQEWKKYTQCGIKDNIELVEQKEEKHYQIQIQK